MKKGSEVLETKTADLLVKLEPDEIAEKALKHTEKVTELERHNDETRRIVDGRNTTKKVLEAEAKKLRDAVNEKAELRPVVVDVIADWKKSIVKEVRQDTGKVISERAMRDDERQPSIATVVDLPKNESPKAVAKRLFSEGARADDAGVEKRIGEEAKKVGVEAAAVLDALVELCEAAEEKKDAKKGKKDAKGEEEDPDAPF